MTAEQGGPQPSFDEIAETFELLDDWEARYAYLIEIGGDLPALDESLKTKENKVDGCASQVWLVTRVSSSDQGAPILHFEGDSDAHIVRGLIVVLKSLLNGQPAKEIAETDPAASFAKIGLDAQLSTQRSNGLRSMIARLKQIAHSAI
ncbi:MAG: SufE family protein [Neomegalonema sp.]|nr:SufE family protein [Neomegalonema sp.]